MLRTLLTCALALTVAGCASLSPAPSTLIVKGELTYAGRIVLPGSAQALVEVRDASQPEGRGVVAERRIDLRGRQVPIAFELAVDPGTLDPGRRYAARGGITIAGRPAWATASIPLEARSGVVDLGTLVMQPVRLQALPTTSGRLSVRGRAYPECRIVEASGADLQGVEWVVEDIDGGGIIDRSRATLVFGAGGRLNGRGSCNTYTGGYVADGDTLKIADVASTMRACAPSLMHQEAKFHAVLKNVTRFEFRADGALVLHADDRRSIVARRGGPA